jgi:UDP-glucose 4-epimerase
MINKKNVLVTGGQGFLGGVVAKRFKDLGCRVVGIGRGRIISLQLQEWGFDIWHEADISLDSLNSINEKFDIVVHCAGNGSVGYSIANPLEDFQKTVGITADLLEYLRTLNPDAFLIYPSSAAVYGAKEDLPIEESDTLNPISPYGYHKKMVEDLLKSYSENYGLRIAIIRFFSIYGPGLTKQLMWDAKQKISMSSTGVAEFWGTGNETRDWITDQDAAELVVILSKTKNNFKIINGASGIRFTVKETIELLRKELGFTTKITFNNIVREGDPLFYHANIGTSIDLGWRPSISLVDGIKNYVEWLKMENLND